MDAQTKRKAKVYGRREVEALIAAGRSIVIVDDKVLKVDAWMPYHPGGDKAIQHMIGRDATDEVTRYECYASLSPKLLTINPQLPLK
jgi:delta8-fatty-acid desaturase